MENDSLRLLLCSVGIVQEKGRGVNSKKAKKKEPGVRPGSEAQGMSRGRLKPPISGRREIPDKSDIQQPAGNNKRSESFHSHLLPCLVGGVPLRERGYINM